MSGFHQLAPGAQPSSCQLSFDAMPCHASAYNWSSRHGHGMRKTWLITFVSTPIHTAQIHLTYLNTHFNYDRNLQQTYRSQLGFQISLTTGCIRACLRLSWTWTRGGGPVPLPQCSRLFLFFVCLINRPPVLDRSTT
jgi:hypothetical protein